MEDTVSGEKKPVFLAASFEILKEVSEKWEEHGHKDSQTG